MGQLEKFGINPESSFGGRAGANGDITFGLTLENFYRFEAHNRYGELLWVDEIANLIPDAGANDLLTQYLKGVAYTAAWFVGLVSATTFTAFANTDTAAKITTAANPPTTNGWQESTAYSNGTRQTLTLGAAAARSIDNSAAKAIFNINATETFHGAFISTNSAKGNATGVLYGEGALSVDRLLANTDTLTITVTGTA